MSAWSQWFDLGFVCAGVSGQHDEQSSRSRRKHHPWLWRVWPEVWTRSPMDTWVPWGNCHCTFWSFALCLWIQLSSINKSSRINPPPKYPRFSFGEVDINSEDSGCQLFTTNVHRKASTFGMYRPLYTKVGFMRKLRRKYFFVKKGTPANKVYQLRIIFHHPPGGVHRALLCGRTFVPSRVCVSQDSTASNTITSRSTLV